MDENSKWDEHLLDAYLTYHGVFNDSGLRERASQRLSKLAKKGVFSSVYEWGTEDAPKEKHAVDMSEAEQG